MSWGEAAAWLALDVLTFLLFAWPVYWLLDQLLRFLVDHGL